MILSNVELFAALDDGRLIIEPEPSPRTPTIDEPDCPFDTHSVDLHLGHQISVPKPGQFAYNLTQPGRIADTIALHSEKITITQDQPYILRPQCFVLGTTLERISLPIDRARTTCLAARIEGKSSRARFGVLVHFTAPTVHPDYAGNLTLEMINLGPADFILIPDMRIAQLIVEEVKGIPNQKPSEFQGQSTPPGH
jgi:dCTP deaminase